MVDAIEDAAIQEDLEELVESFILQIEDVLVNCTSDIEIQCYMTEFCKLLHTSSLHVFYLSSKNPEIFKTMVAHAISDIEEFEQHVLSEIHH